MPLFKHLRKSFFFDRLDLIQFQVHRRLSAEHRDDETDQIPLRVQLVHSAEEALRDLPPRAARFAPIVGVSYGRITIRNQRTRWGS